MTALEPIIRDEIRARGPMRFDRYMELALYHPQHGYYAVPRRIGRGGDFFTSVSVGPLFGQLLARQARQMWQLLGKEKTFRLIEQGGHDGQLAADILGWSREHAPDFFAALRYGLIEPSAAAREIQRQKFTEEKLLGSIDWIEPGKIVETGLFLSNELVDAFPVRLVCRRGGEWRERHVILGDGDSFAWDDLPIDDPELVRALQSLPEIEGYTTEINLVARSWMAGVGQQLRRGYVLTIDYGFPASVYYAPFRTQGTLTTYAGHRRAADVLLTPGERDITAHVDFSALARVGEQAGLTTLALIDQQRFLMGVAHDELSANTASLPLPAWNTLTHPEHLGSRFQVLVQAKDAPGGLDGLRYVRAGGLD